jgi:hypothetical protein
VGKRQWFEVRVRECLRESGYLNGGWVDGKWVKKSHFYEVSSPEDAVRKYRDKKGKGLVMSVEHVKRDRLLGPGIGDFFTLGDKLLRDLQRGGTLSEEIEGQRELERIASKNKNRGYYEHRKKATN